MKDQKRQQAFVEMLGEYDAVIRRVCFVYADEARPFDDLYQETMLNLWRGFGSFRNESQLSTWIYRLTVNTCLSFIRANSRHSQGRTDLSDAAMAVAGDDPEQRDRLMSLYEIISRLDPIEKAMIMLWLDSRSYAEIAEVTGISANNVAVRLHRIKDKIKRMAQE